MRPVEDLLEEGIARGVCGVCRVVSRNTFDLLTQLIGTLGQDEAMQGRIRDAGGLCNAHAWAYARMSTDVSIHDLYHGLLVQAADKLEATGEPTLPPRQCTVCTEIGKRERQALDLWLWRLERPEERARYQRGCGLCLPHLGAALRCDLAPDMREFLVNHATAVLRRLAGLLAENVRKHKALLRHEITTAERSAPDLVLWQMVGGPEALGSS